MKRKVKKFQIFLFVFGAIGTTFCVIDKELPLITRVQLALRNGQDKPEIWIAYQGNVFDVTHSRLWREGKHYEHWAGQDLTGELKDAPHTEDVFTKFEIIGKLESPNANQPAP